MAAEVEEQSESTVRVFTGDTPSLKLRRGGHACRYPPTRTYGEAGIPPSPARMAAHPNFRTM
jgi:hypothetical protein